MCVCLCVLRGASVKPGHRLPLVGWAVSFCALLKFTSRKIPVILGDRQGHGFLQTPTATGKRAKLTVSQQ